MIDQLTDEQLIEHLATKVMGWTYVPTSTLGPYYLDKWSMRQPAVDSWDPFTDLHAMWVVDAMLEKGWDFRLASQSSSSKAEKKHSAYFARDGRAPVFWYASTSHARAISMAAYEATKGG